MATHTSRSARASGGEQRFSLLKIIGALTLLILFAWFILANTATVAVMLWWSEVNMPMWIALLVTFIGGWGFGMLVRLYRAKRPDKKSAD